LLDALAITPEQRLQLDNDSVSILGIWDRSVLSNQFFRRPNIGRREDQYKLK
jgi:hypothetical protein